MNIVAITILLFAALNIVAGIALIFGYFQYPQLLNRMIVDKRNIEEINQAGGALLVGAGLVYAVIALLYFT